MLAKRFRLRGIWGLDFVLDSADQVWPVDLNPRITASAELFEAAIRRSDSQFRSVLDLHLAACQPNATVAAAEFEKLTTSKFGSEYWETKRIVFNSGAKAVEVTEMKFRQLLNLYSPNFFKTDQLGKSIADVPRPGDRIESGHPFLTIRTRAKVESDAEALSDEMFATLPAWCRQVNV